MVRVRDNPNQPEESHSNQSEVRIPDLSYKKKNCKQDDRLVPRILSVLGYNREDVILLVNQSTQQICPGHFKLGAR